MIWQQGVRHRSKVQGVALGTDKVRAFIHRNGRKTEHMGTYADKLVDLEVG